MRTLIAYVGLVLTAPLLAAGETTPVNPATLPPITYVMGSTFKINQLLGEIDKERHTLTLSRSDSRYQLQGADLGYSFEHFGRLYFLFGDSLGGRNQALDSVATLHEHASTDPERGLQLDFLTSHPGMYLSIEPPGIDMGAFEVPVAGISLNNQMYVIVDTLHSKDWSTDRAVLTRARLPITPTGFQPLRTLSQRPSGKFLKVALHRQPEAFAGLPNGGPFVFSWGTGAYRHSDAYLSIVPESGFESGQGVLYFAGLDATGAPIWKPQETAATPVLTNGTMGDLSVTWCQDLRLWLMTYDSRPPAAVGILFAYARTPWGPWSTPQVIFNAVRDHALGSFIHDPTLPRDDGLAGPVIGKRQHDPRAVRGGAYAPFVIERYTRLQRTAPGNAELHLYYVLSTWNPYVVVLMSSRLRVDAVPPTTSTPRSARIP